jgi:DNA-binding ferritin-like protein
MPDADPLAAAQTTKAVAALLRDARSLLRRTDKLAQAADAVADPETTRLAAEARQAIEQLVHHIGYLEERHKRQARDAGRRGR